jgi:hypothetical protein
MNHSGSIELREIQYRYCNSGSAVMSSIYKQLPRNEVIAKAWVEYYDEHTGFWDWHWEFAWFPSKAAARRELKGMKCKWCFAPDGGK